METAHRGHELRDWSAEHRLGALQTRRILAGAVLGAPVNGKREMLPSALADRE